MRTAEANAVEFGRHERGGEWVLGLLVACSVDPGTEQGARRPRNDRYEVKLSAAEFARRSGTTTPRIMRYYEAWQRAAQAGVVPSAAKLSPADVDGWDVPMGYDWKIFFDASTSGGRPRASTTEIVENRTKVAASMTPLERSQLRDALDDADERESTAPPGYRPRGEVVKTKHEKEPGHAAFMLDRDVCRELSNVVNRFGHRVTDARRSQSRRAALLRDGMRSSEKLQEALERCGEFSDAELEALLEGGS